MRNWFYLANPSIMMFVWGGGGGLEPGIILYTSLIFCLVLHVLAKFIFGDPQWSLMEERVAWMLDWQAVWAIPFFIRRT